MSFVLRPPYRIETERLVLRPWALEDAPALGAALAQSREHLLPWMAWARDEPAPRAALLDRIRRFRAQFDLGTDFVLGIFDRESGAVVGGTGLHHRVGPLAAEIGYWVHVDHVGRGIATEVAAALTQVGLGPLPYLKLEIRVVPENRASAAIPRRLGYRLDGLLRSHVPGAAPTDPWRDAELHSLLRGELAGSAAAQHARLVRVLDAGGEEMSPTGSAVRP
jgi:RimJ/RimL family protein N-acetyltransferase